MSGNKLRDGFYHQLGDQEVLDIQELIQKELFHAEKRFPCWPDDPLHGIVIVAEEAGEAVKAQWDAHIVTGNHAHRQERFDHVIKELAQTAAMCMRQIGALQQWKESFPSPKKKS